MSPVVHLYIHSRGDLGGGSSLFRRAGTGHRSLRCRRERILRTPAHRNPRFLVSRDLAKHTGNTYSTGKTLQVVGCIECSYKLSGEVLIAFRTHSGSFTGRCAPSLRPISVGIVLSS